MSSRDMTLTEIKHTSKSFDDTHTIKVSGFKDSGRNTTRDLILSVRDELLVAINNLDKKLTARIDNLVSKNNLKE